MAIFHLTLKTVSRSKGQSVVAAAAYRAGERLKDQETGEVKDFARKHGVAYREIQLPPNAPQRYQDRATLWNAVQAQETRRNAQLAREVEVALPQELARATQIRLVQDYVDRNFVQAGMCADWALHDKGDGNPHAHILLTTRSLKANGDWAPKQKSTYLRDSSGAKISQIEAKTGQQKIGARGRKMWQRTTVAYNDWNERDNAEKWRADWAASCNRYLTADQQIDHRSYDRQGSEQMPTIHEGHTAQQMGDRSERVQLNQQIKAANHQLAELQAKLKQIQRMIAQLVQRLQEAINERVRRIGLNPTDATAGAIKSAEPTVTESNTDAQIQQRQAEQRESAIKRQNRDHERGRSNYAAKPRIERSNQSDQRSGPSR